MGCVAVPRGSNEVENKRRSPDGANGSGPKWPARWQAPRNPGVAYKAGSPNPGLRFAPSGLQLRPMETSGRMNAMAQWMWDARARRLPYRNLPDDLRPASLREAYAAQEAYYRLAEPVYGAVCGAKIATTTKVMQELMGIDHPCGGAIFSHTIHYSPAHVHVANFVNVRIESEIALMLGADLPASGAPWRRDMVVPAVAAAMPAFELIEDRNADYTKTEAVSLIVENCWNGGIVIGAAK